MPSTFSMNIVKMIAVSAVVAIVLSLMGKQIGSITYNVLHPSDDPVETGYTTSSVPKPKPVAALPVKPVVKKPPATTSRVVKKSVPVHNPKAAAVPSAPPEKKTRPDVKKKTSPLPNAIEMHERKASTQALNSTWAIQTGVYTDKKYALEDTSKFALYSPAAIVLTCESGKKIYAVRLGNFPDSAAAGRALAQFRKKERVDAIASPLYGKQDLLRFCKK